LKDTEANPDSTSLESKLRELTALMTRAREADLAVGEAWRTGSEADIPTALARSQQARSELTQWIERECAANRLDASEFVPDAKNLRAEGGVAAHARRVVEALSAVAAERARRVENARSAYLAELRELALPLPTGLSDAKTEEEIAAIRRDDASRLALTRFRRALLRDGTPSTEAREAVAPTARATLYRELAAELRWEAYTLCTLLDGDPDALRAGPAVLVDALLGAIQRTLDAEHVVPPIAWTLAANADEPQLVARLSDRDLQLQLCVLGEELTALKPLAALVGDSLDKLPNELARRLAVIDARRLEPGQRVVRLATVGLDFGVDESLVPELLEAVNAGGRPEEIFLVADALARAGHSSRVSPVVAQPCLQLLVERACEPERHAVSLAKLTDGDGWAGDDLDAFTVLLFVVAKCRLGPSATYRHPSQFAALRELRPVLVSEWLEPMIEEGAPHLVNPDAHRTWARAHDALLAWDRDILKKTCYQGWGYAEDYQRHFRQRLVSVMAEVRAGTRVALHGLEPGDIIDQVRRDDRKLPPPQNPALTLMVHYLEEQLARVRAVADAMELWSVSFQTLGASDEPPSVRSLSEEAARQTAAARPIRAIYDHVQEQVKCARATPS
jgi:hypothetical protein